jgi:hypothetical protein
MLACEHIGKSRNCDNSLIRRALQLAIEELERVGFIEPCTAEERYRKKGRGNWRVVFDKKVATRPGKTRGGRGSPPPTEEAALGRRRPMVEEVERAQVEAHLASQGARCPSRSRTTRPTQGHPQTGTRRIQEPRGGQRWWGKRRPIVRKSSRDS